MNLDRRQVKDLDPREVYEAEFLLAAGKVSFGPEYARAVAIMSHVRRLWCTRCSRTGRVDSKRGNPSKCRRCNGAGYVFTYDARVYQRPTGWALPAVELVPKPVLAAAAVRRRFYE